MEGNIEFNNQRAREAGKVWLEDNMNITVTMHFAWQPKKAAKDELKRRFAKECEWEYKKVIILQLVSSFPV